MEEFKGTKGEWSLAHFANDSTSCNCGYVLSEGHCGAIATVHHSGDNPDLIDSVANAMLIAAAPDLLEALQDLWIRSTNLFGELPVEEINNDPHLLALSKSIDTAKSAIKKALNK